jgi:hypothetical protein
LEGCHRFAPAGREKVGGSKLGRPWPENGVKHHRRRICNSNTVCQINITIMVFEGRQV